MYQLSGQQLREVLSATVSDEAEIESSNAVEARVEQSLPFIAGLSETVTSTERQAVYANTIEQQLQRFVQIHGSAFGDATPGERKTVRAVADCREKALAA